MNRATRFLGHLTAKDEEFLHRSRATCENLIDLPICSQALAQNGGGQRRPHKPGHTEAPQHAAPEHAGLLESASTSNLQAPAANPPPPTAHTPSSESLPLKRHLTRCQPLCNSTNDTDNSNNTDMNKDNDDCHGDANDLPANDLLAL